MSHHFKISVQAVDHADAPALIFNVASHDDLIVTIERVRRMNIVSDKEAPAFAVGLKLLAEVVIQHRDDPLFADLSNAIPAFIKQLKTR